MDVGKNVQYIEYKTFVDTNRKLRVLGVVCVCVFNYPYESGQWYINEGVQEHFQS